MNPPYPPSTRPSERGSARHIARLDRTSGAGAGGPAQSETTGAVIERLVREHQDAVRTYLVFLGANGDQVDDLVQETFLSFLRSTFQERDSASTRAYLRTVARNHLLKEYRRAGSRPPSQDLDAAEHAWEEYESDDGGEQFRSALQLCMAGLRDDAQRVLRLRYGASTPRATIAERLGMSEAGVKSIIVRARRRLRECVERRLGWSDASEGLGGNPGSGPSGHVIGEGGA
ncbi:MAG: sigma-70 family RNA polymerase sigma factor [Planctomycetota bacterium]